jgi:hypothetical protein
MPTQPAASPSQTKLLTGFVTLAQTAAAATGNQMAVLGSQITTFQDGMNLFTSRYGFWDQYISQYQLESRYLNGTYLTSPIIQADFTNFLNNTGRLYTVGSQDVTRIGEFDTTGATSTDETAETFVIPPEATARALLTSGFNDGSIPSGLFTDAAITPATTSVMVENAGQTQVTIPTGIRILISDGTSSCVALITAVQENDTPHAGTPTVPPASPLPDTYTYTLTIEIQSQNFTTLASHATLLSSFGGFTNAERTSQTASLPQYQSILTSWISLYQTAITNWKTALDNQYTAIQGETSEDQPDTVYTTAQAAARTQLTNYLAHVDVSDSGFAPNISLASTRTSAIPTRISWILARLTATTSYDNRYKYAQLLYQQSTGQASQLAKMNAQQTQLAGQQAASNAHAASLQQELN